MLHSLVYVSRATSDLSVSDLLALRDQSAADNAVAQITGLLVHRRGTFLQSLEGPKAHVLALYERIQRDVRNTGVTLVWSQALVQRSFPRWSMALTDVDEEPGVADGTKGGPGDPDIPEAALVRELLELFDVRD